MSIYESAVKKPITTSLIFIAIALIGLFSLTRIPVDLMPDTDTSNIMVITSYPGTSAEDIESNISKVLENSLNSVGHLKHITSNSRENVSVITLEFEAGTDVDVATNDVRDKLDAVRNRLPDGATSPIIFKFGADDIPIAILAVESEESSSALKKILEDKLTNRLARVDGVGSVSVAGAETRTIQIYCDPMKLEAYHLTVAQVGNIVAAENMNIPAGNIDVGSSTVSVRVEGEVKDPQDFGKIVLANVGGHNLLLSEVAEVKDTVAEYQQENYINGKRGAIVVINKQSGANSVQISDEVARVLPELQKNLPSDVKVRYLVDTSDFIRNAINSLLDTIIVTFLVVMLVVFVFLGSWKATLIVMLTIPVSLIASFIYLLASGNTLNIISLSSLSIAIGMVVDDAIVVLENISSKVERGAYPKQAAIYGTNEVGLSVIASTLTMLAVFLPLTMVQGQAGLLFRQLGWIISIVMIVSTIGALSLIPMLSSLLLKRNPKRDRLQEILFAPIDKALRKLDDLYARLLGWAVRHRKRVIFSAMLVFIGSVMLLPMIKTEYMPTGDRGFLQAKLQFPTGTNIQEPRRLGLEIGERWRSELPEIQTISMSVGQADASNTFATTQENGNNIVSYSIGLVDAKDRKRSSDEVAEVMRKILREYKSINTFSVGTGGMQAGNNVTIDIYGYDFTATDLLAREVKQRLEALPASAEVSISRKEYTPEYRFVFDRDKLATYGLNLATASGFLRNAVNGSVVTYYREDGDEYDVRVSVDPRYRQSLEDISDVAVYTPKGVLVRLGDLGKIVQTYTPPTIERKDRSRVVTVSSTVAPGYVLSDLVKDIQDIMSQIDMPGDLSYQIGGAFEDQQSTFSELFILMALIVILVFIVMAAQFESLTKPFVIMFSVPFAFTGVFLGLLITQIPLGVMALIGLIMLIGIVVKNGIVLIDYTILLQERGYSVLRAAVAAGRSRLRPVLMTTLTTVLGMVPMAIGIGEGSEMWQSMGVTVAWGLSISTLVTLVLIPTVYASFQGIGMKRQRKRLEKKLERKRKKC